MTVAPSFICALKAFPFVGALVCGRPVQTLRPAGAEAQRPFTNELLHLMQRLSPERLGSSRPIRPIPSPGVLKDLLSKKVQRFAGFDQQVTLPYNYQLPQRTNYTRRW